MDVESDWGGRTSTIHGITEGIPKILNLFNRYNIKAIFFVSTEILYEAIEELEWIKGAGHEIASHGHFHVQYHNKNQMEQDLKISQIGIEDALGVISKHYRAPKFTWTTDDIYSDPTNHIGLLKQMWFPRPIHPNSIFYLHPFDIVGGTIPPNLFCHFWYSRPKAAWKTLQSLVSRYR